MILVQTVDNFLNSLTMYRLMHFGLLVLAGVSIILGFLGFLPFSGISLSLSLVVLIFVTFFTNKILAKLFSAIPSDESYVITGLILFFILAPFTNQTDFLITFAAGVVAMVSKYLIAINKKHIFNPAAFAVLVLGLLGFGNEIWWVGSSILLPFVLILGLLVVRKIRRFILLFVFILSALITICLFNLTHGMTIPDSLMQSFTSWPLIFFGTIMLVEPQTSPQVKKLYLPYGVIVGILFGSQFQIGPLFSSPELALILGNIFNYIVSPKNKYFLNLKEKKEIAPGIHEFRFKSDKKPEFTPGQYMEWTLSEKKPDQRGNRRYFTIASTPNEDLMIAVKVFENSSAFKTELLSLNNKSQIVAGSLAGDFILPQEKTKKLVFIAGGIGITPFRSILKYLIEEDEKRDIIVFYTSLSEKEFVFKDVLKQSEEKLNVKINYVITDEKNIPENWEGEKGYISESMLKRLVPDFKDRLFYLSGPNRMVDSYKLLLNKLGVRNIITDYFPGY